jgi:hypothetical protein
LKTYQFIFVGIEEVKEFVGDTDPRGQQGSSIGFECFVRLLEDGCYLFVSAAVSFHNDFAIDGGYGLDHCPGMDV